MTVTALSAGNSLANPNEADIFVSEESILRALSFVRHSTLPMIEKNALRDLFLAYAGTADAKQQADLKAEIIKAIQNQPALASLVPKGKPVVVGIIGMSRPVPTFAAPAATTAEAAPPPVAKIPDTPPVSEVPVVKSEPVPPPAPKPEPVAPKPEPIAAPQTTNAKARIDAIKRDINGRVGNPVNLIETDEKVGRAYMTALLDAMKRSSRGDNDLSQLESAYQAALAVIQNNPAEAPVTPAEKTLPPEAPTPPTPPPPPPVNIPVEIPREPEVVIPPVPVPPPKRDEGPKIGLYHRPEDEVMEEEVEKEVEPPPTPPVMPTPFEEFEMKRPTEEVKLPPPPQKSVARIKVASVEVPKPVPPPQEPKVAPAPKPVPPPVSTVAKSITPPKVDPKPITDTKLHPLNETSSALPEQISRLKTAAAAHDEAAKKPITDLKAPEIDQGLRLLLAEWTLFKNSSFFRKKPTGIDSPLYKQLAPLPMASVIAGRFEGVTPEIKHNLADYMTGWRYEQGIMHDMGESFEHYLRRVVKEILEKQRQAKVAPENNDSKK